MASYGEYIVEVEPGKPGIGDKPSVGPAYGNSMAVKGFSAPIDACKNLYDAFQSSVNRFGASPCLGKRIDGKGEFVWETFKVSCHATAHWAPRRERGHCIYIFYTPV